MSIERSPQPNDAGAHLMAVDLAARITAAVVANGGTVAEATRCGCAVLHRAHVPQSDLDASYGAVAVNWTDMTGEPRVRMERVESYGFDFGVLTRATNIAADYSQSTIDLDEAHDQMENIAATGTSWSRKATVIATAAASAAAPLVYGGDWIVSIAGIIAYLTLVFMMQKLGSLRWPSFFIQIAAGILASAVAAAMRILDPNMDPTSVVISIIIIMMAGMTSTGAVQDTITGHYMHGLGRIYEGLVNTAGLVVGVRLGAALFTAVGVPLPVTNEVSLASIPLWLMVIAAALVAVGNGTILQSPGRVVFSAATLAMIVYVVYAALSTGQGADAWARGVAAFAAGIGTAILPRFVKAPSSAMSISSFLVLLPGTLIYQGIWGVLTVGRPSALLPVRSVHRGHEPGHGTHGGAVRWRGGTQYTQGGAQPHLHARVLLPSGQAPSDRARRRNFQCNGLRRRRGGRRRALTPSAQIATPLFIHHREVRKMHGPSLR